MLLLSPHLKRKIRKSEGPNRTAFLNISEGVEGNKFSLFFSSAESREEGSLFTVQ